MSYTLYIAEKPSVGRAIAENLGGRIEPVRGAKGPTHLVVGDAIVSWVFGHILEQAAPEDYDPAFAKWTESASKLPLIPEKWQLKPVASAREQLGVLDGLIKKAGVIVSAGDPDREGQLLIDEVLEYLGNRHPVKRILPNALDNASVKKAIAGVRDNADFFTLYQSGLGRQRADWLVGMNLTRACSVANERSGNRGVLSVGRVQTPTLAMIVGRDLEIENFKPQPFFSIVAHFRHAGGGYIGVWKPSPNQAGLDSEGRLTDERIARALYAATHGKPARVADYKVADGSQSPPLPFSLSKLQAKASQRYGMGAQRVLELCQSLYETHKVSTYPRTDSQYLPESQYAEAPDVLRAVSRFGDEFMTLAANANTKIRSKAFNDSKVTAHHGIVPTGNANYASLSPDEAKIFSLIVKNYIAQFYPDFKYKQTTVLTECGGQAFVSNGRTPIEQGWRVVFGAQAGEDDEPTARGKKDEEPAHQMLPLMKQGDAVACEKVAAEKKQTKPPQHFTEGTLVAAMTNVHELVTDPAKKAKLKEIKGIGTEATRGAIIETLKRRQFVTVSSGKVLSTPAAREFIRSLPAELTDVSITAVWENALDAVEAGRLKLDEFLKHQATWLERITRQTLDSKLSVVVGAKTEAAARAVRDAGAGAPCPKCGAGSMRLLRAKAGENAGNWFLGCSGYPACKNTSEVKDQDSLSGSAGPAPRPKGSRAGGARKSGARASSGGARSGSGSGTRSRDKS